LGNIETVSVGPGFGLYNSSFPFVETIGVAVELVSDSESE
jgi:hypothetical protein